MDIKIASRNRFISMTITLFMFVIGNYPNVYATIDSSISSSLSIDPPKDITLSLPLPLPLPFNSHIADALNNNQLYTTNNLIPFP